MPSAEPKPRFTRIAILLALVALVAPVPFSQAHEGSEDHDEIAFLGISSREEVDHAEGGARVTSVIDDTAAARAGLREDDIIVEFDGAPIHGPGALTQRIRDRAPGDSVEIVVLRDGRRETLQAELGSMRDHSVAWGVAPRVRAGENARERLRLRADEEGRTWALECDEGDCGRVAWSARFHRPLLGVQLAGTTPELRRHLGGEDDAGALISKVIEDSVAEEAGLLVGDLLVSIDGQPVAGAGSIRRALSDKHGKVVDLEVIRDGSRLTLTAAFPERDDPGPDARLRYEDATRLARAALREARETQRDHTAQARTQYRVAMALARESRQSTYERARETYREALRKAYEEGRTGRTVTLH